MSEPGVGIRVDASDDVPASTQELFRRKYQRAVPEFPHHVVVWAEIGGSELPLCYVHFSDCGDILLGGGACSDDRLMRRLSPAQRTALRDAGGVYQLALAWAVRHFAARFEAIFGYCGDALAERIDRAVGFESTPHEHLLVYWTRPSDARRRHWMIEKAHSFAPF